MSQRVDAASSTQYPAAAAASAAQPGTGGSANADAGMRLAAAGDAGGASAARPEPRGTDDPAHVGDGGRMPMEPIDCPGGGEPGSTTHVPLSNDERDTFYILYVPTSYMPDAPAPVLLDWHGFTSGAEAQATIANTGQSPMNGAADRHGFIVVTPNSESQSWNAGACCGQAMRDGVDEIAFTRDLIKDLETRVCIDPSRIYSTGYSNGGFLSHHLACQASDLIAAIAPVAGVLGYDDADCNPGRPISVLQIHGTDDPLIPYAGGSSIVGGPFRSVQDSSAGWAERNGCTGQPEVTYEVGNTTCETWTSCAGGTEVSTCTAEGAGHCWPGWSSCVLGGAVDLEGAEAIWGFLQRFHR